MSAESPTPEGPRVLHVRASNFYGGPEQQLYEHLVRAKRRNRYVAMCVFAGEGMSTDLGDRAREKGVRVCSLDAGGKFSLEDFRHLKRFVVEEGIDIICGHGFKPNLYIYLLPRKLNLTKVGFLRGKTQEDFKVAAYTVLERVVVKRFDHVVALSESQKKRLMQSGIESARLSVVPNTIDCAGISEKAASQSGDLELDAGLVESERFLITVGRLSREKGHAVMVDAMKHVHARFPDVKLIMIGDGAEKENLDNQISRLDLRSVVILPGFSREVPYYLKRAAILVNPSHSEEMPNIVLEGRALRVPIVATDVGGVSEIVPPGKGALLVPKNDSDAMASAILRILEDDVFTQQLVETGYDEFVSKYDPERQTEVLLDLYRQMSASATSSEGRGADAARERRVASREGEDS